MRPFSRYLTGFISIFVISVFLPLFQASATGIIIASGPEIRMTFRDSSQEEIRDFALGIADQFDKVILHIGSGPAFKRGGLFFYETSKANLRTFARELARGGVLLDVWMLDSFGAKGFEHVFDTYQSTVSGNLRELTNLGIQYQGIVIDLEWINYPEGENGGRLLEILRYIQRQAPGKTAGAFASLVDDTSENLKRGYDQPALKEMGVRLIPMLYIIDGGFYRAGGILQPYISDNRIKQLRQYYRTNGYHPAVSLENGLIVWKNNRGYFIKTITDNNDRLPGKFESVERRQNQYFEMTSLRSRESFPLVKNDTTIEEIEQGQIIFQITVKAAIVEENDYIWRYFLIR